MRFSETVMAHFLSPQNVGTLDAPCGEGNARSLKRRVLMRMFVRFEEERITQVRYLTHGCVPAIAAGSVLASWAEGRSVDEVLQYTADDLTAALGGLPPGRGFCADLAINALRGAIKAHRKGTGG